MGGPDQTCKKILKIGGNSYIPLRDFSFPNRRKFLPNNLLAEGYILFACLVLTYNRIDMYKETVRNLSGNVFLTRGYNSPPPPMA